MQLIASTRLCTREYQKHLDPPSTLYDFQGKELHNISVSLFSFQAGTDVEVTWKVLEVPSDADPKVCEKDYDMDKLWSEKQKETLNCLKLNATVKACNELQENSRNKIDGC